MPKAAIGRRPICSLMPIGLPVLSSTKLTVGQPEQRWRAVAHFKSGLDRRSDDLLRRNAIDPLGPRPHELDAAARHDEGLEAVGPQIGEQFEHRLIDQFGIGPLEAVITRGREPVGDDLLEFCRRHAGMGHRDDFDQPLFAGSRQRLHVAVEHRRERLLGLPLRMHRCHGLHAVECEGQLHVHRLLDPERAVIVEGRDALVDRHEVRPALRRDARDEVEDRRFGRAVVPGRERIACACATAPVERSEAESSGSIASDESRARRSMPGSCLINSMTNSLPSDSAFSCSRADSGVFPSPARPRMNPVFVSVGIAGSSSRCCPTIACAGTSTKACSTNHLT